MRRLLGVEKYILKMGAEYYSQDMLRDSVKLDVCVERLEMKNEKSRIARDSS